jgi:hypothetical protein
MMNTGGHNMEMTMEDIMAEDIRLYEAAAMPDRFAGDLLAHVRGARGRLQSMAPPA